MNVEEEIVIIVNGRRKMMVIKKKRLFELKPQTGGEMNEYTPGNRGIHKCEGEVSKFQVFRGNVYQRILGVRRMSK